MANEPLLFRREKEIIEESKQRNLTSDELLYIKSRTFYPAIKLLGLCKGKDEADKESYVRTAYNIFRELDECEDVHIQVTEKNNRLAIKNERSRMIERFLYVMAEISDKSYQNGKGLEAILRSDNLRTITKWLVENEPDEAGKIFAEHFGRGVVLKDFYELGKEGQVGNDIKMALDYSVKNMAVGMLNFLDKGHFVLLPELDKYCDYVAGDIGKKFLNKLVKIKDGIELDERNAEHLAKYLQYVNIVKNIREDYEEGRRFLPSELLLRGVNYEFMMDEDTENARMARAEIFHKVLNERAGVKIYQATDYVKSIPDRLSGYKAFCLFPFLCAHKTIENMRAATAERVFKGHKDAIKIPYDNVEKIFEFTKTITTQEEGARLNPWLDEYRRDPKSFSFKPGEYEQWSPNWLKVA